MNNKFIPDETVNKLLISSTSRFVGQYESEATLFTHAWAFKSYHSSIASLEEYPSSRNAFIFGFLTEPVEKKAGIIVPDYSYFGRVICAYLSVYYGKRFDSHGLLESNGMFLLPNLQEYNNLCNIKLPIYSSMVRKSFPIPLNLTNFSYIEKLLLDGTINDRLKHTFSTCCKFYLQALQNLENDTELAYINLVTAGEVLSNYYDFNKDEMLDSDLIAYLDQIERSLENGQKISNIFSSRLRSIKKRFVKTICQLVNDDFFDGYEAQDNFGIFRKETFEENIKAAYDLRSKYIHTGVDFGQWVTPFRGSNDVQYGKPVIEDQELSKILFFAPTFMGLERTIRYVLLNFLSINYMKIDTTAKS